MPVSARSASHFRFLLQRVPFLFGFRPLWQQLGRQRLIFGLQLFDFSHKALAFAKQVLLACTLYFLHVLSAEVLRQNALDLLFADGCCKHNVLLKRDAKTSLRPTLGRG